jgi:hypothetical protein
MMIRFRYVRDPDGAPGVPGPPRGDRVLHPSRARRAAGLLAGATIGLSTTLVGLPGVASATPSGWSFSSADANPVVVPAGTCAIDWTIIGSRGGAGSDDRPGVSPLGSRVRTVVSPGNSFTLSVGAPGHDAVDGGGAGINALGSGSWDGRAATDADSGGGGAASVVLLNGQLYLGGQGGPGQGAGGGEFGSTGAGSAQRLPAAPGTDVLALLPDVESQGSIRGAGVACGSFDNPLVPAPFSISVAPGPGQLTAWFQAALPGTTVPPGTTWEYSVDGSTWRPTSASSTGGANRMFTVTGLTNGQAYRLKLRATNPNGVSETVTAPYDVTPFARPGTPTHLVVEGRPSALAVSWQPPTAAGTFPLSGYQVTVIEADSTEENPGPEWGCDTDATTRECVVGVPAGGDYVVYVSAVDDHHYTGDYVVGHSGVVDLPVVPESAPVADDDLVGPSGPIESVRAGKTVVLTGSGFAPYSKVQAIVYSTPTDLGVFVTDGNGEFEVTVTIPGDLPAGHHSLVVQGVDPDGTPRTLRVDVTVSAAGTATVTGAELVTASDELAYTGFSVLGPLVGGVAAVALGAGLVVVARRRTRA